MPESKFLMASLFVDLYNEFKEAIKNMEPEKGPHAFGGITSDGQSYSAEVLFELLKFISTSYALMAYIEDKNPEPAFVSAIFKKLSKAYFGLASDLTLISGASNILMLTALVEKTIKAINKFDFGGEQNG